MRGLIALLRREWRDVRTMTWAYAALVPVAMVVVRWYLGVRYDGFAAEAVTSLRHMPEVFPVCVLLYAALVASDLVAGDLASRRSDQLALLPVGLLRVWFAKVAVLVAATLGMAVWVFSVQAITLGGIDGWDRVVQFAAWAPWSAFANDVWSQIGLAVPGAAIVGAILLVSTAGLRGIGAVLLGAGVAAALAVAYEFGRGEGNWLAGDAPMWCVAAVVAVFGASAVAFVRGRAHTGARLRPAVVGAVSLVALLGAPAAAFSAVARHVAPGGRFSVVESVFASPRGPYLAVRMLNTLDPSVSGATFVVSLDDGLWREVPLAGARPSPWTADGLLPVIGRVSDGVQSGGLIDPVTVTQARIQPKSRDQMNAELRARIEESKSACWWYAQPAPGADKTTWNLNCYGPKRMRTPRAVTSLVRPTQMLQPGSRPGAPRAFCVIPTADRIASIDAETGEVTTLATSPGRFDVRALAWCDSRGVLLLRGKTWSWFEFATGEESACPDGVVPSTPLAVGARLLFCGRTEPGGRTLPGIWDPASGRTVWTRSTDSPWGESIASLADGGAVIVHADGTIDRFDADLRPVAIGGAR